MAAQTTTPEATPKATLSDVLRLLAVAALGFALPAAVYHGDLSGAAVPMVVVTCYSGIRFGWLVFAREPELLRGFFWLFAYVFFGLAALTQYDTGTWPLPMVPTEARLTETAWVILLFLVAFDVGGFIARNRPRDPKPPRRVIAPNRIALIGLFAVLAAGYELSRIGGPGVLATSRDTLTRAVMGPTGESALGPIHFALLGLPMFVTAYLLITARRQGRVHGWFLTTVIVTAATLVLINPITSSRYSLGTVTVGLALAMLIPLRRGTFQAVTLGAFAAFLFAFRVFNEFRFDTRANQSGVSLDLRSQLVEGDYDAFQQTSNVIHFAHVQGLQPTQLLGPLLFWVPRSVWPGKPHDTGVIVGQAMGLDFVNLSAPLPSELYMAGGVFAVGLGGVFLGFLWARLDRLLIVHGPVGFLGLLIPILAVYQFILLRGSLLQAMGALAVMAALLALGTRPAPDRDRALAEEPSQAGAPA